MSVQEKGWRCLESQVAYSSPYLSVETVRVETPTRPHGATWTVVHRKKGCVVIPLTPEGRFVLIRQERIPVRATVWEFPAGQVDEANSDDEAVRRQCALRELREETGYELGPDGELIALGFYYPSFGFTDETTYLYLARGVVPSAQGVSYDQGEAILGSHTFTPAELRGMIASGELCDANSLVAYARMVALNLFPQG